MAGRDWVSKWFDKEDEKESPKRTALAKFLRDEVKDEDDAGLLHELLQRIKDGK